MNEKNITCKESSQLIEKIHGEEIEKFDQQQLENHLNACRVCSIYYKQSLIIERVLKAKPVISDLEVERIKQKIKEKFERKI